MGLRADVPTPTAYLRRMSGDAADPRDPQFPNLSPAVVEGYRRAPETMVAEIIAGELSLLPRPRRRHARGATRLLGRLVGFDDPGDGDPGGWVILVEPELHLGPRPDVLVPDLAGWRTSRTPPGFLADDAPGIALAPDWICEVLSPSTELFDRGTRRDGAAMVAVNVRCLDGFDLDSVAVKMVDGKSF